MSHKKANFWLIFRIIDAIIINFYAKLLKNAKKNYIQKITLPCLTLVLSLFFSLAVDLKYYEKGKTYIVGLSVME